MTRLAADAASLFRAWWYRDRIRSSPREGKLLRLAPGAILCVDGKTLEVQSRDVIAHGEQSVLRYRCRDGDSQSELWVTVAPAPTIVWCRDEDSDEQSLTAEEIEVWSEYQPLRDSVRFPRSLTAEEAEVWSEGSRNANR